MSSSLRIIVTGLIGQYPLGGVTWDYVQYVIGLARLGHDVYYIEDTGQWPYAPSEDGLVKDCKYNTDYLHESMSRWGLGDRWAYRFAWQGQWFGLSDLKRTEVLETADLLINVSGTLERPDEYRSARRMAYIDSDPVFTQVKIVAGNDYLRNLIDVHDVTFSFGEKHSEATPDTGHDWVPTRQPVVLSEWRPESKHGDVFTTVMNWRSYNPIEYGGREYGQKDIEFRRFFDLPSLIQPTPVELAANQGRGRKLPIDLLRHKGWRLVDPGEVSGTVDAYRSYIESSAGEWSVAKNGYVQGQSGWFSCRSACYLATGRPVVVQETGFSDVLPVGCGIVPFRTLEEAAAGVQQVVADYDRHARAARDIAEEWFDSDKVLRDLVDRAMRDA
ncbi:MAG: hypothetical protein CMJ85_09600 [Planctomycetes bacterium]|jgi:hypothetical protein|nr:hypothetical protein [Planctomycetota bacterium]